jgi:hypothetical protein
MRNEIEAIAKTAGWPATLVIEWPTDPTEDDRRSIHGTLEALRTIVPAITADALGKKSAAEIRRMTLVPGPGRELAVTRNTSSLTIAVGMAADLRDSTLRPLIEQHL